MFLRRLFSSPESAPQEPPTAPQSLPTDTAQAGSNTTPQEYVDSSFFSRRAARQFGLFLGGAGLFILSTSLTRRAMLLRYKPQKVPQFHPSNVPHGDSQGAGDALDALVLATANVGSLTSMLMGGAAWGFNVSSFDELRTRLRAYGGLDVPSEGDKKADEELEEWVAGILGRKEGEEPKEPPKGIEGTIVSLLQAVAKKEEKNVDKGESSGAKE